MGGAAGANLLFGMIRTKFAAVLIGATGVGLQASFMAILGVIAVVAGLGLQSSAVRAIAVAVGNEDEDAIGRAVLTLSRICWLTGLIGMALMMIFSAQLSQLAFGSDQYALDIATMGIIVLLGNLSSSQLALLQGKRRIGDMARANLYSAVLTTPVAIALYYWLNERGIVPTLVIAAALQLILSWHFARLLTVPRISCTWLQTLKDARVMVRLGLVFMWTGLMGSAVNYFIVILITQNLNTQAVGLYSAAYLLSGVFVGFVLGAMGADYYPRITAVAHDKAALNRLVNEQTEIGLLLAVPGLLATFAFAPWIISIFYTVEFLPAVEMLQWLILGCLGRVLSWPLGFVMMALGKGKWFWWSETLANIVHIGFALLGVLLFGLIGVTVAFFILYIFYTIGTVLVANLLTGFVWTSNSKRLIVYTAIIFLITFIVTYTLPLWSASLISAVILVCVSMYCLRNIVQRVGPEHAIAKIAMKIPVAKMICCA